MTPDDVRGTHSVLPAALANAQRARWERALSDRANRYGTEASEPARRAAETFRRAGVIDVLELGAGQGRDSVYLAHAGFNVVALDFTDAAMRAIRRQSIEQNLGKRLTTSRHDVRQPLPFPSERFDACYSHMLLCMAMTDRELGQLSREIRRLLRPAGLCLYTARTIADPDYGAGVHRGQHIYELDGFAVHYFTNALIRRVARGFRTLHTEVIEEGTLPRRLVQVTMQKDRIVDQHAQPHSRRKASLRTRPATQAKNQEGRHTTHAPGQEDSDA